MPPSGEYAGFHTTQEILTKSRLAALVPLVRRRYIIVGFGHERDTLNHSANVHAL